MKAKYNQDYLQSLNKLQTYSLHLLSMPIHQIEEIIAKEIEDNPLLEFEEVCFETTFPVQDVNLISIVESELAILKKELLLNNRNIQEELLDLIFMNFDKHGFVSVDKKIVYQSFGYTDKDITFHINCIKQSSFFGVGCEDIKDFLLVQLINKKDSKLALQIVTKYLDLLSYNLHHKIKNILNCDADEYDFALQLIQSCHPYPVQFKYENNYIVPDAEIIYEEEFKVIIQQPRYKIMLSDLSQIYELNSYAKPFAEKIRLLNSAMHMRNETLYKIIIAIIQNNEQFFINQNNISPLTMTELAKQLNLHKSTISRAVGNKYVKFNAQIFPLKEFFIRDTLNCGLSQRELFQRIEGYLLDSQILSDQVIVDKLKILNILISRRTITKYRLSLGIKSSRERKKIAHERKTL